MGGKKGAVPAAKLKGKGKPDDKGKEKGKEQAETSGKREKAKGKAFFKSSYQDELGGELAALGLRLKKIAADGNCFFRALSDQLQGDEGLHAQLRLRIMNYIQEREDEFRFFVEDDESFGTYVARMKKDGVWAGNMELVAASHTLGANLTIYQAGQPRWTIATQEQANAPMLHLSYHDGQHYNSVRMADDPGTGPPHPIVLRGDGVVRRPAADPETASGWGEKEMARVANCTACEDMELVKWALQEANGTFDLAVEKVVERLAALPQEEAHENQGAGDPQGSHMTEPAQETAQSVTAVEALDQMLAFSLAHDDDEGDLTDRVGDGGSALEDEAEQSVPANLHARLDGNGPLCGEAVVGAQGVAGGAEGVASGTEAGRTDLAHSGPSASTAVAGVGQAKTALQGQATTMAVEADEHVSGVEDSGALRVGLGMVKGSNSGKTSPSSASTSTAQLVPVATQPSTSSGTIPCGTGPAAGAVTAAKGDQEGSKAAAACAGKKGAAAGVRVAGAAAAKAPSRNKDCPCGSRKKYKACCGPAAAAAARRKGADAASVEEISKGRAGKDEVVGKAAQLAAIAI